MSEVGATGSERRNFYAAAGKALCALTLLAVTRPAAAQIAGSVTLTGVVTHSRSRPGQLAAKLSRADCLEGDVLSFPLTMSAFTGYTFEAWVGSGCDVAANRVTTNNTACWLVYRAAATSPVLALQLPLWDLLWGAASNGANVPTSTPVIGDVSECDSPRTLGAAQDLTLYFMLVGSAEMATSNVAQWKFAYKLHGPPAPTSLVATSENGALRLNFDPTSTTNLDPATNGFEAYCDPPAGSAVPPTDAGACQSNTLLVGQDAPVANRCGSATSPSAGSVIAGGLDNGSTYAVAIAATDSFYNVGPLSALACAAPDASADDSSVTSCGACSVGRRGGELPAALLAACLGACALARRRAGGSAAR